MPLAFKAEVSLSAFASAAGRAIIAPLISAQICCGAKSVIGMQFCRKCCQKSWIVAMCLGKATPMRQAVSHHQLLLHPIVQDWLYHDRRDPLPACNDTQTHRAALSRPFQPVASLYDQSDDPLVSEPFMGIKMLTAMIVDRVVN